MNDKKQIEEMAQDIYDLLPDYEHNFRDCRSAAEEMLKMDYRKQKHGYWKPSPDGINPIRCSECNMHAPLAAGGGVFGDFEICRYPSKYCPNCGAKMDGKPPKGEKSI